MLPDTKTSLPQASPFVLGDPSDGCGVVSTTTGRVVQCRAMARPSMRR